MNLKKSDLIGGLEGFPIEIARVMLKRQVEQGNKADITVFQKDCFVGKSDYGFYWKETIEKYDFWKNVIGCKNFDIFFDKYPKPFVLKKEHLIGDIAEIPYKIVLLMLKRQVEQGNEKNVMVFQKDRSAYKEVGGFDWYETPEGLDFWVDALK